MKHIVFFILFAAAASTTLNAQQPPALAWASGIGGTNADNATAVSVDASGASFYTGVFRGTVDFDPGPGTTSLTAPGTTSASFVCKFDSTGVLVWAKAITSTTSATPFDLAVDNNGAVIISGGFTGTADFDPDPTATVTHSSVVTQLFILKLSATGSYTWVATMGGGLARAQSVAVDAAGDVYAAGDFQNTIDFDPGAGTANLTALSLNDAYVCKFSAGGAYQWAVRMGGGSADFGTSVATDGSGVYVGGYFGGTVDFDPGSGTSNLTSAGGNDGFLVKLTTAGAFMWANAFGGTGTDAVGNIAPGPGGDVWISGNFIGAADFDPGSGSTILTNSGTGFNGYVARLTSGGNLVWARHMASTSGSSGVGGLAVDVQGAVYCPGSFGGSADLDPGAGSLSITATGTADGFFCKLNSSGALVWAGTSGAAGGASSGAGTALDIAGQPHLAGSFAGTIDADLGAGTQNISSAGATDIFMAKYRASDGTAGVVQQPTGEHGFVLSPNPVADVTELRFETAVKNAAVSLIDAAGRTVRSWQNVQGRRLTMDLAQLPSGVYVLSC